jgi:hypothetical protein
MALRGLLSFLRNQTQWNTTSQHIEEAELNFFKIIQKAYSNINIHNAEDISLASCSGFNKLDFFNTVSNKTHENI